MDFIKIYNNDDVQKNSEEKIEKKKDEEIF